MSEKSVKSNVRAFTNTAVLILGLRFGQVT